MSTKQELTTQEAVQNAINEIDFKEIISVKVKEEAEKAIKRVIEDQFTWGGTIKKQIEEEFEKIELLDFTSLGVDGLSSLMSESIIEATNDLIAGETKEVVQQHLYKALDGYSKINNINKLVESLVNDLDEKENYDEDDNYGDITIAYHEETSMYSSYVHKFWTITSESDSLPDEELTFKVLNDIKGEIYSLKGDNLIILQPIYDQLKVCDMFDLKVIVKEDTYSFDNTGY